MANRYTIEVTVACIQEIDADSYEEAQAKLNAEHYDVVRDAVAYRVDDEKLLFEVELED